MTRDVARLFAGPAAWFVAHVASWMLAPPAHETGGRGAIWAIDAAALAVAVLAGLGALARLRRLAAAAPVDRQVQSARFLAGAGVAVSALSILLMIGLVLPTFLLVPGAEP